MADVDRVHLGRAMRQQHVGEASGRGADVETDAASRRQAEVVQRVVELQAAA